MGKKLNLHRAQRAFALAAALLAAMGLSTRDSGSRTQLPTCPEISCPQITPSSSVVFRVDGAPQGATFSWTLSTGSILGPSNRRQLRASGIPQGPCVATVRMARIPAGCRTEQTCRTFVGNVNRPPTVSLSGAPSTITLPCPEGMFSRSCPTTTNLVLSILAIAQDPDNDVVTYEWTVVGGRFNGSGKEVVWDLPAEPGHYLLTVQATDGNSAPVSDSISVDIVRCGDCKPCPTVKVSSPTTVVAGQPVTFTANLNEATDVNYKWLVSPGTVSKGQGTSSIIVDTSDLSGKTIIATVELESVGTCQISASGSTAVASQNGVSRKR